MCGYCVEKYTLDILRDYVQGKMRFEQLTNDSTRMQLLLRETPDFLADLNELKRISARKKQSLITVVSPLIIMLRGMEILLLRGFDSWEYRKLLSIPLYREAVCLACNEKDRKAFDSLTEGLDIGQLGLLYEAETYFQEDRSKALRTLANVLSPCRNLLKHYISWWLDGKKLELDVVAKLENLGRLVLTDKMFTGDTLLTPLSWALQFRFNLLVRVLYFSTLMVGSSLAGKIMLLAIAQRDPAEIPGFGGEELWLQRIASLKLFDLEGFESFRRHVTALRPTSFYYINLVRGFTVEQKQLLMEDALHNPDVVRSDHNFILEQWLMEELGAD